MTLTGATPVWCLVVTVWAVAFSGLAQKQNERPIPLDPVEGERQARQLVGEILTQRPEQTYTNAVLKIRDPERKERQVRVHFETFVTSSNWSSVYTASTASASSSILTVVHVPGRPNEYLLGETANSTPRKLSRDEIMASFAGSDFWPADLGLEFLHWPKQRVFRKEMYSSRFCAVLDSTNTTTASTGYARIRSWLTSETPHDLVRAEAYDSSGKRIKVFDVVSIEKVKGQFRVESVEMRDLRRESRTIMEFE